MIAIFPLAGSGMRFQHAGYKTWKPLIEIEGIPMLARSAACMSIAHPEIVVPVFHPACQTRDRDAAVSALLAVFPQAEFLIGITAGCNAGAADTVLDGVGLVPHSYPGPVVVLDCDRESGPISLHGLEGTAGMFVRDLQEDENPLALSYAVGRRTGGTDRLGRGIAGANVVQVIEKPASHAVMAPLIAAGRALPSAGIYWWPGPVIYAAAAGLAACGCGQHQKRVQTLSERYVAPVLNATADLGLTVKCRYVAGFRSFGTPDDLHAAVSNMTRRHAETP